LFFAFRGGEKRVLWGERKRKKTKEKKRQDSARPSGLSVVCKARNSFGGSHAPT